jgi:hypothetical protein
MISNILSNNQDYNFSNSFNDYGFRKVKFNNNTFIQLKSDLIVYNSSNNLTNNKWKLLNVLNTISIYTNENKDMRYESINYDHCNCILKVIETIPFYGNGYSKIELYHINGRIYQIYHYNNKKLLCIQYFPSFGKYNTYISYKTNDSHRVDRYQDNILKNISFYENSEEIHKIEFY